ncbi:MAG: helix-turn-helix domain-containing protein [Planctomycetota bacterium]|jgi:excisionase family DNA binding protein
MASTTIQDRLLSIRETANMLGISARQVHRLRSDGKLCPSLMVGGSVRIRLSTLTDWLDLGCPSKEEFEARKEVDDAS